ncbi:MAG TPA: laminin B domain-containing protein [Burkholderiales bacterium]|nr:laminin B domain-containing protein [Burkholderiales bacterium]
MTMRAYFTALALAAAMSGTAQANVLVESTFDTGNDGWRIGEFFSNSGDATPTFVALGGNPGGFIRTTDVTAVTAFQAPGSFLGDLSAAYGGMLQVDQRVASHDNANYPLVLLGDGTLRLQFRTTHPAAGAAWTHYDIPLLAAAGWEVSDGGDNANNKPDATEAQLQQVLANLSLFNLRGDWHTGSDQSDLDNVRILAIPEPGSYALLLAGLGLLGFVARRRKKDLATA